ncbi:hypothetical protein B0O99DRAFT_642927 [Bisporella sp. PMI_857]|nr:hypothetical protein B0O99DRAFT_642927 [Bisporella sp. PMI_857]
MLRIRASAPCDLFTTSFPFFLCVLVSISEPTTSISSSVFSNSALRAFSASIFFVSLTDSFTTRWRPSEGSI